MAQGSIRGEMMWVGRLLKVKEPATQHLKSAHKSPDLPELEHQPVVSVENTTHSTKRYDKQYSQL